MTMVTVVEVCMPLEREGPQGASLHSEVAFLGSDRSHAKTFIEKNPDYCSGDTPWCWFIYDVVLNDLQQIPYHKVIVGSDGKPRSNFAEAWQSRAQNARIER